MSLTREQILGADDRPKKKVATPEWGGEVYVKTLSAAQREEWEKALVAKADVRATMVAFAVCDEKGAALFSRDDVKALAEKSAPIIERIFDAAFALNRVSEADIVAAEKNSDPSLSDSSVSD